MIFFNAKCIGLRAVVGTKPTEKESCGLAVLGRVLILFLGCDMRYFSQDFKPFFINRGSLFFITRSW
jgi:hypothetical protein